MVDVDRVVDFCSEHQITFEQFMFLYILYKDKMRNKGRPLPTSRKEMANVYKYSQNVRKWANKNLQYLQDKKGFLDLSKSDYPEKNPHPDDVEVTEKFCELLFLSGHHFETFWENYPGFTENFEDRRKSKIPLKGVDKEKLKRAYMERVDTIHVHDENMEALKYAKENDLISIGIKKWVLAEYWKDVLKEKEESTSGPSYREKTV